MQDRRRATRLGSWLHAVYTTSGPAAKPSNALIRTTSEGGVSVFSQRAFEPGTVVRMEIRLPGQRPVTFTAEARWSRPLILEQGAKAARAYETGMVFRDIAPDDRQAILLYTVLSPPTTTA